MISLQPHSGAVMLALYYHLNHPDVTNFDVRMTKPRSKIYRIVLAGRNNDTVSFRTGKDWPCYSKIRVNPSHTKFSLGHDHSSVEEEFKIDGKKLYLGSVRTEANLNVNFKGDFTSSKKLDLSENFKMDSGRSVYKTRSYEIDNQW